MPRPKKPLTPEAPLPSTESVGPPAPGPVVTVEPITQETPEAFPEIMPEVVAEPPAPKPEAIRPEEPQIPIKSTFEMQVCVPDGWEDTKIKDYAKANNPPSTESGWKLFPGPQGRCTCPDRKGYQHVWLVA